MSRLDASIIVLGLPTVRATAIIARKTSGKKWNGEQASRIVAGTGRYLDHRAGAELKSVPPGRRLVPRRLDFFHAGFGRSLESDCSLNLK